LKPKPVKTTAAGKAYLLLQSKARQEHRPTDELVQIYVLEGFLDRLAASRYASKLVLKGGVLLAAYDVRRPTRDIDFQGRQLVNDGETIMKLVKDVTAIRVADGLDFDASGASVETIRDGTGDEYSGIRVTLRCSLATANVVFHIDVNVGDPIWPLAQMVTLPRLLGKDLSLSGYPLPMVYAEKVVTALQRGTANTRWRDFADIYLLSRRHSIEGRDMRRAIVEVARFRRVDLVPLANVLDGFESIGQSRWVLWRRKQTMEERLPASFAEVLAANICFADPVIADAVLTKFWNASALAWQ